MIRNAGGRASDDAIRSLVISYKLLGTREWFVIHHTNCGMEFFTDEVMRGLLANSLETAAARRRRLPRRRHRPGLGRGASTSTGSRSATTPASVVDDVTRIRSHPLVPSRIPIYGYIYDVKNGRLVEVKEATEAGQAAA